MTDLLLELFSEEIPARMQPQAAHDLVMGLRAGLEKQGMALDVRDCTPYVTPRRLAVWVKGLPLIQPDTETERKGPKTSAPAAAIEGFLRSTGLALEQLEKRGDGKDETYFARLHHKGRPTAELLKEVIEDALKNFPWPKSMRWGNHDFRWVRPLHSIACIFGGEIVPVQFGHLTADNITYGHRFLAPEAIQLTDAASYEEALKKAYVVADFDARKQVIREQTDALAKAHGLALMEDAGLLEEVTGLVEWPIALMGKIDAKFGELPREVIISIMRGHQKYFAAEDASGNITHFITIANRFTADEGKAIIAGNERVLRARLSDGKFFWDQDRAKPLEKWASGLRNVTYHARIGSLSRKMERLTSLAVKLAEHVPGADKRRVQRAGHLCKADLVTGMVGEFAELQGIMGQYYAIKQGEDPQVAEAIRDQYKHAIDDLPVAPVSICIALADRLDTLATMFSIGEKPSGSKDPFALRRAAIAIIQIILKNNIRIHLNLILNAAVSGTPFERKFKQNELVDFFIERLHVIMREEGIEADRIKSIFATGEDDLVCLIARVKALHNFLQTEDGSNLLAAYKRAINILKIEEKKDSVNYSADELDTSVLRESEETLLTDALIEQSKKLESLLDAEKFEDAMLELSHLRPPIDLFFDKIMVNCEDRDLRANRLRILASIRDLMNKIADFSHISG